MQGRRKGLLFQLFFDLHHAIMKRRPPSRAVRLEQLEARQMLAAEFLVNVLTPRIQTSSLAGTAVDVNPRGDAVVVYGGRGPQDADGVYLRHFPRGGQGSFLVTGSTRHEDGVE